LAAGLPLKCVVTCFLECGGRILLLRRSQDVGSFRGKWAGVSGYIETTALQQAYIEIAEELGLQQYEVELVSIGRSVEVEGEGVVWIVHPFLFSVKDKEKISIDREHSEMRWVEAEEIGGYDTVPMLKEALAEVYNF